MNIFKNFMQTYLKVGRNKKTYRLMKLYLSEISKEVTSLSAPAKVLLVYIQCTMVNHPNKTPYEITQLIVLDYDDKVLTDATTTNRNNFFSSIRSLVEVGILIKAPKPKHYFVNPYFMSCCSEEELDRFQKDMLEVFRSNSQHSMIPAPPEWLTDKPY